MQVVSSNIDEEEAADMMEEARANLKRGFDLPTTIKWVAKAFGRSEDSVRAHLRKLKSTLKLAEYKLQAAAGTVLADRFIKEATPDQIMDLFQRDNFGIIAPKKQEQSSGGGFFLNVNVESLGAVNVKAVGVGASGASNGPAGAVASGIEEAMDADWIRGRSLPPAPDPVDFGSDNRGETHGEIRTGEGGERAQAPIKRPEVEDARGRGQQVVGDAVSPSREPRAQDAERSGGVQRGRRKRPQVERLQASDVLPERPTPKVKRKPGSRGIHLNYHHESFDPDV